MAAKNLKQARVKRGLTQNEAAKLLGVSDGAYKNYEQGKREPKYELLLKIADLFHVTTDYLLGREVKEKNPIDELAYDFDMSALEQKILDNYLSLPPDMRTDFMEFLQKSVKEVEQEQTQEQTDETPKKNSISAEIAEDLKHGMNIPILTEEK